MARGIDGLAKLAEGREDDLNDDERFGLEAIVLLEGRPAILIQEGDFLRPPHEWSRLTEHREGIREVIARSGRVEINGHLNLDWLGTASLVAPTTLMTNRHVAREFCSRDGDKWVFRRGMTTRIDFLEELGSTTTLEFEITEVIGIHDDHDLALLRVEQASSDGHVLPDPLPVAATELPGLFERDVYVVGYPAWDSRRNEPEPIRRIFTDIYNVKRLQPGGPSVTRPPTPPSSTTAPRSAGTLAHRSWTWRPIRSSACTSGGGTEWGTTPCRSGCSRTIRCSRRPTSTFNSRSLSSVQLGFAPARSAGGPEPVGSLRARTGAWRSLGDERAPDGCQ